jgi:methylenetetrahydrofolate reductase (NADPH)
MSTLSPIQTTVPQPHSLLADASLEMTGKDVSALEQLDGKLAAGTRVNITFLANEDQTLRIDAAAAVVAAGLTPVPHVPARRLRSAPELAQFLATLADAGAVQSIFAVAGDPSQPEGPYEDALALIHSGVLQAHGVKKVSISGYPEGHPDIAEATLWDALELKAGSLAQVGMADSIITQFGFDSERALNWIEEVRSRGIELPVRIGVPGPVGVKRLLSYARRFGVATSTGIARKYGLSLTNLMATAGPERHISALAEGYDPTRHGAVALHFYTFGGLGATADWIATAAASASAC